jgi:hypothetical protein
MRLMAFAAQFWETGFGPLGRHDQQYIRRVRTLVAAQVGTARAEALWAEGQGLDVAQAVAIVLNE